MSRGVIHRKVEGSDEEELPEGMFQFKAYEENAVAKIVDEQDIYTDLHFTQLRFGVGDRVLCLFQGYDDGDHGKWVEHEVLKLWPRPLEDWANRNVKSLAYPLYDCKAVEVGHTITIYDDLSEKEIRDIPLSTRFDVGDKVVFNAVLAEGIKLAGRYLGDGWRDGKVVSTIPPTIHRSSRNKSKRFTEYMGSYECSFQHNGKVHKCYILADTDEHIARDDPRTRLMNAIEDDCSRDHISYLVDEFGVDVIPFQDQIIASLVGHARYNALWWIQENLGLKLTKILYSGGDEMLTNFATSRHILRFLQKVVEDQQSQSKSNPLRFHEVVRGIDDDRDGRHHFVSLIKKSSIRAYDYFLSPLALGILFFGQHKSTEAVPSSLIWQFRYIADRLEAYREMFRITLAFTYNQELLRENFQASHAKSRMRQYLRHCWDYRLIDVGNCDYFAVGAMKDEKLQAKSNLLSLGQRRDYNLLHLMIEEDPTLLDHRDSIFIENNRDDQGEYVQLDLKKWVNRDQEKYTYVSLVDATVIGETKSFYTDGYSLETDGLGEYHRRLEEFLEKQDFDCKAWIDEMMTRVSSLRQTAGLSEHKRDCCIHMFERKIALMTDDDNVEDQWKLLDYLVKEKDSPQPSLALAIAARQCSAVRWVDERGYSSFTGDIEPELESHLEMTIDSAFGLGHSTGAWRENKLFLLSLLTIQYDDIQTLNWLFDLHGADVLSDPTADFNLVHAAAHFGRIEIMHCYLSTLSTFASLVMKSVGDGKYKGLYAAHVAASCGHIAIADVLLSRGCPVVDMNHVSIVEVASKSSYEFVRSWVPPSLASSQLEQDLNLMLTMACEEFPSLDALKYHVLQSKCMDVECWQAVDCWKMHDTGDLNYSYASVVTRCLEVEALDFCLWLCTRMIAASRVDRFGSNNFFEDKDYDFVYMEVDAIEFVGTEVLAHAFDSISLRSVKVRDYISDPHPLMHLLLPYKLQKKLSYVVTKVMVIRELHNQSLLETERLLVSQSGEKQLQSMLELIRTCSKIIAEEAELPSDEFCCVTNFGEIDFNGYYSKPDRVKLKSLRQTFGSRTISTCSI
ncbi:unnamed protein product [Cylindrotheca closterium]|uniref:Uncharacterized protein n=1 Tax=Cylindrotheca closterium TaxID=2856 RepID=A0AAD2CRR9_9STRA|nr:unnamed protein product [Cylindrotheca closterium]